MFALPRRTISDLHQKTRKRSLRSREVLDAQLPSQGTVAELAGCRRSPSPSGRANRRTGPMRQRVSRQIARTLRRTAGPSSSSRVAGSTTFPRRTIHASRCGRRRSARLAGGGAGAASAERLVITPPGALAVRRARGDRVDGVEAQRGRHAEFPVVGRLRLCQQTRTFGVKSLLDRSFGRGGRIALGLRQGCIGPLRGNASADSSATSVDVFKIDVGRGIRFRRSRNQSRPAPTRTACIREPS